MKRLPQVLLAALAVLAWPTARAAGAADPPLQAQALAVGELLRLRVPWSKSEAVEVTAEGEAVRAVHDPLAGTLTIQGVRPGRANVQVRSTFALFRDPDAKPRLVTDLALTVAPGHSRRLGEPRPLDPADVPAPRLRGALDWEGPASLQATELSTVIGDAAAWGALWRSAFGAPAPAVDFSTQVVACVFLGHQADWLYRITLGEPARERGLAVVPYQLVELVLELAGPFRASGQYRLKAFPREAGQAVLLADDARAPRVAPPGEPPRP